MLGLAILFFILAVISAVLGFGGLTSTFAALAQVMFVLFLLLFVISFTVRALRGKSVA